MSFLPIVIWRKRKRKRKRQNNNNKEFKVLVLSPRAPCAGTPTVGRALCLSSLHPPPPDPWLQKQGGAGASTGPKWAASHDLVEPQAASFNLATVDEHKKKQKNKQTKTLSSKRGTLEFHPSLDPMVSPNTSLGYLTYARILIIRKLKKRKRKFQSFLIHKQDVFCRSDALMKTEQFLRDQ